MRGYSVAIANPQKRQMINIIYFYVPSPVLLPFTLIIHLYYFTEYIIKLVGDIIDSVE